MRRLRSHGLVFTEFLDPAGERWVEVLREADNSIRSYRQLHDDDGQLTEFVEHWIRHRLGADPPPTREMYSVPMQRVGRRPAPTGSNW